MYRIIAIDVGIKNMGIVKFTGHNITVALCDCSNISMDYLKSLFIDKFHIDSSYTIIIEKQTVGYNNIFISGCLYLFFSTVTNNIIFQYPVCFKLGLKSYRERKKKCVDIVNNILANNNMLWNKSGIKKDDISDALLLGLVFIYKNKYKLNKSTLLEYIEENYKFETLSNV